MSGIVSTDSIFKDRYFDGFWEWVLGTMVGGTTETEFIYIVKYELKYGNKMGFWVIFDVEILT